jgi:hypothetical protein
MIKLVSLLWSGCWHKWKIVNDEVVDYSNEWSNGRAHRYTLQCEHCGNIKTRWAK